MKSTLKLGQKALFLVLSVLFLAVTVSCAPEAKPQDIDLLPAVDGVPAEFRGTLNPGPYNYELTSNQIKDLGSNCIYNVVSTDIIAGTGHYSDWQHVDPDADLDNVQILLCQVKQGTQYTPDRYFFAVALCKQGGSYYICCPMDYDSRITSLQELKEKYTPVSPATKIDTTVNSYSKFTSLTSN